ncbi:MAG: EamA family transporter [Motiliproteus sp.]
MINASQLFLIILCVIIIASGQILFKVVGLRSVDGFSAQSLLSDHVTLGTLLFALTLYMISTFLWIHILRTVPLSTAYPFMALSFVLVPLSSWVIFKEPMSWSDGTGATLIVLGIVLMSRGSI